MRAEERTPAVKGEMGPEYMENTKKSIKASKKKGPDGRGIEYTKPAGTPPTKKEEKPYNPYGKDATANPSNMSATTGS